MIVIASDAGSLRRVLEGRHIVAYDATEMALCEQGADGVPLFGHPEVPCIQCGGITLRFDDGTHLRVQTDQTPDGWGLLLEEDPDDVERMEIAREEGSIYRKAALEWYPRGVITRVDATVDPESGSIRAIALDFGGRAVSLVAGEFEEQFDGSLRLALSDESILFFRDADGWAWAEGRVARGHLAAR